jgi:dTDP-4-dehydrorhamnose reductase
MKQKILVLGASGMLGNAMLRYFAARAEHEVVGIVRSAASTRLLPEDVQHLTAICRNADDTDALVRMFEHHRPTVVINCVGLVKQYDDSKDPLAAIPVNSVLPHRLARLCALTGARLVHLSTDCVFTGNKGMYQEVDVPDAQDVYGRTKLLGEVNYSDALTLRTSIIGHELAGENSLVCWFLSQKEAVRGFSQAIFSGLPTVEVARVIDKYVLNNPELRGLYHLSAEPIDKFSLLKLIATTYGKDVEIIEDSSIVIDRSLDSTRFRRATGYCPETWPALVRSMYSFI